MNADDIAAQMASAGQISEDFAQSIQSDQSQVIRGTNHQIVIEDDILNHETIGYPTVTEQLQEIIRHQETMNTAADTLAGTTPEDIDLIIEKADLYHIELGEEAMLAALQAISTIISADSNTSDGEIIDYIDGFLQEIGVR